MIPPSSDCSTCKSHFLEHGMGKATFVYVYTGHSGLIPKVELYCARCKEYVSINYPMTPGEFIRFNSPDELSKLLDVYEVLSA